MTNVTHPCFGEGCGFRIHLPIAKKCNTKCNYCKLVFSDVEKRPGASREIVELGSVVPYIHERLKKYRNCKIIGIAGPGDPLANPEETFGAFDLITENFHGFKKCLCTNGFNVTTYASQIERVKLDYFTLTINSISVDTLWKIYDFVDYGDIRYSGHPSGELVKELQKSALDIVCGFEFMKVKVNIVYIPGINDGQMQEILEFISTYNVSAVNIIPLIPVPDTKFAHVEEIPQDYFIGIRQSLMNIYPNLSFMTNCQRCRSDACG